MNSLSIETRNWSCEQGETLRCKSSENNKMAGFTWIARFSAEGKLFASSPDILVSGTNKSLTFTAYRVDKTSYPPFFPNCSASSLNVACLGKWILSSFTNMDEVILGIKTKYYYGDDNLALKFKVEDSIQVLTIHFKNGRLETKIKCKGDS